jgi:membrane protein
LGLSESGFISFLKRVKAKQNRIKIQMMENRAVKFVFALAREIGQDDISNMAASISYYAFLALFPLLLSLLSIFGLFFPSESILQQLINFVGSFLPGSKGILENNISEIVRLRGALGIVGIIGLLWSGSGVFTAINQAINRAWDIKYEHPFYIRKPREFLMLFIAGTLIVLSIGATTLLSQIGRINLPVSGAIVNIGTAILALFFSLVVFTLTHKFTPLNGISWRHVWPGAVLSTFLFEAAKTLFVFYLNNFNRYDVIYGSLASVIILLVWIYFSAFILLLGAEFSSLLFRLKREGESVTDPEHENINSEGLE